MAFRFVVSLALVSCFLHSAAAAVAEADLNSVSAQYPEETDPRFFIILPSSSSSSLLNINTTAALLSLLGAAALLTALGFLIYYVVSWKVSELKGYGGYGGSYGSSSGSGYGSGYGGSYGSSSGYRRSNDIDWESLNILDYISMMEEMWRKFDVKDMACQKRVICEIHQNEASFGPGASKIVKAFSYIQYLSLFSLPEAVRDMVHEYRDAAEKGRDVGTDCGKVFDSCEFSFKDTFAKYLANDKK